MTNEEIIAAAREAGFHSPVLADGYMGLAYDLRTRTDTGGSLTRFAEIIAAREREACAKVCEDIYNDPEGNNGYDCYYARPYLDCANDIRARGNT